MKRTGFLLMAALVIVAVCTSLVFCSSTSVKADSGQVVYGAGAIGVNSSIVPAQPSLINISDQEAINLVRQLAGNDVASRMLYRYTAASQPGGAELGTIGATSKSGTWGGYLVGALRP